MATWSREVEGYDAPVLVGYAEGIGYFCRVGESQHVDLSLFELIAHTRGALSWADHKPLYRLLMAAPALLAAHEDPADPTSAIVKSLCA